jgi:NNP family nitrate/nitrite transporter-like MFS transporter
MPAVYESLVNNQGLTPHTAWRVAFVVPGIVIVFVATCMLLLCPDTPTGKWSMRLQAAEDNLHEHGVQVSITDASEQHTNGDAESPPNASDEEKKGSESFSDHEAHFSEQQMIDTARGEIVSKPSWKDTLRVISAPQTLVTGACYFCTFGTELAVNIILGDFYSENFPSLGLTTIGSWAAMFGLMSAYNDG